MKKLTIRPRLGERSIQLLERLVNHNFSTNFSDFLKENAGLSHFECIYQDVNGIKWEVSQYNLFPDLHGLTKEFIANGLGKKIPFAYDPGGWHFCLSFDEDTFGQIFINRWTDHSKEEQLLKIADSFEEFIDGLQVRE